MDIQNLSIIELKQLLSRVNQDLKSIKRRDNAAKKAIKLADNDYVTANNIAKTFTGKSYDKPVENAKLKADIQIQQDILDYLHSGKHIITTKSDRLTSKSVRGAKAGTRLYRKFSV